jgi:hypothetical protein
VITSIEDTTDTARSASYLDLLIEIDSEDWLRKKLYDKWDISVVICETDIP